MTKLEKYISDLESKNTHNRSAQDVDVLLKMLKLTIKDRKTFIDFYNEIAETIGGKKLKPLDLDFIVPESKEMPEWLKKEMLKSL